MNQDGDTRLSEATPDPWLGRELDGYRVESVIGRGGMGVVYKAVQLSLGRPVAIKVIPEAMAEHPQFVERFKREVDILSKLSHPNVVTVFERGESDGRLYVVMECVDGTSLRDVMKAGPLPKAEALSIVRSVLQALEHAHERGIVHRDIKPENVLVAPGGVVKVADFGLSRLLGPQDITRLTHTHLLLGTFEYMAPEQREKAKEADERSDLYATGVVLYEMLAGELPIGNFDLLSEKRPRECDARIDEIVSKSLNKSPDKRYQRASEMGDAVSRLLSSPLAAPPAESALRTEPLPPRRREAIGSADTGTPAWAWILIAVLVLGALMIVATVFLFFSSGPSMEAVVAPSERSVGLAPAAPDLEESEQISGPFAPVLARAPAGVDVRFVDFHLPAVTAWVNAVGGPTRGLRWALQKPSREVTLQFPDDMPRRQAVGVAAAYQLLLETWWGVETDRIDRLREAGILDEFEARAATAPVPPAPKEGQR